MRSSTKAIMAVALVLTVSSTAIAQQQPAAVPPAAPEFLLPPGQDQKPSMIGGQPGVTPMASPIPQAPNGAFETAVPTVGASDPAQTMTLEGGPGYVKTMTENADARLQGLLSNPVSDESASLLEQMTKIKRSNMLLGLKNEEAELAVGLWGVLFNNEHAQAWRQRQDNERKERVAAETAAQSAAAARQVSVAPAAAAEQQAQVKARAMPVVYEIMNGEAIVLVPGGGEVFVRAGSDLPNGMRVVSVGNSVVVEDEGVRRTLGFGTSAGAPAQPAN